MDNFKGFSLFNDVDDESLQAFNRGRVMANIFQDHMRDGRVNIKGSALVLGYFKEIPEPERLPAQMQFKSLMEKEGFALVAR
jgi:hypothetical protein